MQSRDALSATEEQKQRTRLFKVRTSARLASSRLLCCGPTQADPSSLSCLSLLSNLSRLTSLCFSAFSNPSLPFLLPSPLSRLVAHLSSPSRLATARLTICFYRPASSSSSKMAAAELRGSCAQAAAASATKALGTQWRHLQTTTQKKSFQNFILSVGPIGYRPIPGFFSSFFSAGKRLLL